MCSANSLHPLSPSPPCVPPIPQPSAFQLGSASGDHQQETLVVGRQGSQLGHIRLQPVLMSHRGQLQLLSGLSFLLWAQTTPTLAPLCQGVQESPLSSAPGTAPPLQPPNYPPLPQEPSPQVLFPSGHRERPKMTRHIRQGTVLRCCLTTSMLIGVSHCVPPPATGLIWLASPAAGGGREGLLSGSRNPGCCPGTGVTILP